MFHINKIRNLRAHELFFYIFIFLLPFQTRILYKPGVAYIDWYFNYHLAYFFYLTDILLIICFASWLIFDAPSLKFFERKFFWLTLAFFSLILVTLFHVKRPDLGWYQTIKWLEVLVLALYISQTFMSEVQFKIAAFIIFISALTQAALGLVQFHVQHSLGLNLLGEYIPPFGTSGLATIETLSGKVIRAYGTFPHPNILGAFLVFGLVCGLYLVSRATLAARKILIGLSLILIFLGLFVTFSRLAWLGAILSIFAFTFYYMKQKDWSKVMIIIMVTIVSCATIGLWFHQTLKARVLDTDQTSLADRYLFNRLGMDLSAHYPLLGVGVGNYIEALKDLYPLQPWQNQPAHNIFIFISAELGVLGAILFIIILFEIFSAFKNIPWNPLVFTLALLGIIFLLMSQFDHYFVTIQQGRLMFFTLLGLIAALPNLYHEKPD